VVSSYKSGSNQPPWLGELLKLTELPLPVNAEVDPQHRWLEMQKQLFADGPRLQKFGARNHSGIGKPTLRGCDLDRLGGKSFSKVIGRPMDGMTLRHGVSR
jgi:hypothetical protein